MGMAGRAVAGAGAITAGVAGRTAAGRSIRAGATILGFGARGLLTSTRAGRAGRFAAGSSLIDRCG